MQSLLGSLSVWWLTVPWNAVGTWVSVILTLIVFSYLVGDNPLYRFVGHLFVGASVGYAFALAWHSVLAPRLQLLVASPAEYWYYGLFFALGLLLLLRSIPPLSSLANLPLAFLFGIGGALAIGGALSGSLLPQIQASLLLISPTGPGTAVEGWRRALDSLVLVLGTICVLLYFQFSRAKRGKVAQAWSSFAVFAGGIGKWVILATFGALFAGAIVARVSLLIARLDFLLGDWLNIAG